MDKAKKDALAGQWSSQDQTQVTSQFKGANSLEQTAIAELDTINTNNFNSKVYNSIQEEGVLPIIYNEAGFSNLQDSNMLNIHKANLSQEINNNGSRVLSAVGTIDTRINEMSAGITDRNIADSFLQKNNLDTFIDVGATELNNGPQFS